MRQTNSVMYGSDALAGVVSIKTKRGRTRVPEFTYAADGGNLGTWTSDAGIGGVAKRFDYYSTYRRFETDNDVPNNSYTNGTYAGRFGVALGAEHRPERHDPPDRHRIRQPERLLAVRHRRRLDSARTTRPMSACRRELADHQPVAEHGPLRLDGPDVALHRTRRRRVTRSIRSGSAPTILATSSR